jgi:hypothetical protein
MLTRSVIQTFQSLNMNKSNAKGGRANGLRSQRRSSIISRAHGKGKPHTGW